MLFYFQENLNFGATESKTIKDGLCLFCIQTKTSKLFSTCHLLHFICPRFNAQGLRGILGSGQAHWGCRVWQLVQGGQQLGLQRGGLKAAARLVLLWRPPWVSLPEWASTSTQQFSVKGRTYARASYSKALPISTVDTEAKILYF